MPVVGSPAASNRHSEGGAMRWTIIVACGALATELRAVLHDQLAADDRPEVRYLPANLHNRPGRIVGAIDECIRDAGERDVVLAYADCGTGGELDSYIERRNAERREAGIGGRISRLPGAHCYEAFAGDDLFQALQRTEPGTFYLTDFLAKHFDALVWQGLGLDRHPELLPLYFGNYRRLVLLSQSDDAAVIQAGIESAWRLGLRFEHVHVGRDGLHRALAGAFGETGPTTTVDPPTRRLVEGGR